MSGTRLMRNGERIAEWSGVVQSAPEPEVPEASLSRSVTFVIPDGFMATISLVPYTEPPAWIEPDEAVS